MNIPSIPYQGESFALITAVFWAIAVILFKKSGETVHPVGLNLFKDVLAAILFVPTLWIFEGSVFRAAPWQDYLLLLASGALGIGIADTLFFMCLNRLGAGLTAIVDCFYSPFIIGLSMLWLGESLSWLQLVGVLLIISAVLAATYQSPSGGADPRNIILGIAYGILSLALMALGIVMIKPLLNQSPLLWVTETRLLGGVVVLVVILACHPLRRRIISSIYSSGGRVYTISGSVVGGYLSMVLWLAGMKFTQVSTAAALNQTTNIFIFIFAAIFLKERINIQRLAGIVLAVLGALLVTFTQNI
ncbi:MAG: DMT family transporter [Candidatus Zixiibacteriota bacterium]|nr:MAG: DMT family transporter [candidate division Zixibacteria bacterium]